MTFRNSEHHGVRRVVVDNLGDGSIVVQPNAKTDLLECSINTADEEYLNAVQVRQDSNALRLIFPAAVRQPTPVHLRLDVPDDLEYAIKAGSADVTVRALIQRSRISTGSGDVSVSQGWDLECSTGSGDISVQTAEGSAARLTSGSGDVTVAEARCPLHARSGSGDVTLKRLHRDHAQANSGSGDITVAATSGSVDLRSASGSLTVGVADGLPAWLDLDSASGAIRIALGPTHQPGPGEAYVAIRATTASGNIAIYRA